MNLENTNKKSTNGIFVKFPFNLFKYFGLGIVATLSFFGKLILYFIYGFSFPILIFRFFDRLHLKKIQNKEQNKELKQLQKEEEKFRKQLIQQEQIEKKLREEMSRKSKEEEYLDESVIIEKESLKSRFDKFLERLASAPSVVAKKIKESYNNSFFVKDSKHKKEINQQALLIDFNGFNEEKSDIKLMYQYIAKSPDGKNVKGYFEAYSKTEVLSYLISEGFEVYNIKTSKSIQFFHSGASYSKVKMANKDLIFFLTQLSTYIKSSLLNVFTYFVASFIVRLLLLVSSTPR